MSVRILPTFNGYTVDLRLNEFRKATPDVALEFIPFTSSKGKKLLAEMKVFARKIIDIDSEGLN
jgi:hypothetical protein